MQQGIPAMMHNSLEPAPTLHQLAADLARLRTLMEGARLHRKDVATRYGFSLRTLHRAVADGRLPRPVRLSDCFIPVSHCQRHWSTGRDQPEKMLGGSLSKRSSIASLTAKANELARSRTSDERKALDVSRLLVHWMINGKPSREAKQKALLQENSDAV
jgi:hypothetical protein